MPARPIPSELGESLVAAADLAHIGVAVVAPKAGDLERLFVNQAMAEILGYPLEEALGLPTFAWVAESERARSLQLLREWVHEGRRSGVLETVFRRKDGTEVPVEVAFTSLDAKQQPLAVLFVRDLTARHAADAARARLEARFSDLIEAAPDGVGIVQDGRFVYMNRRGLDLLGYDSVSVVADKPMSELFDPTDAQLMGARIQAMLREGAHFPPHVYTAQRSDGRVVRLELTSIVTEYRGRPAVLGFARDVSERVEVEAQLARADRLVALGTLAAGVAHEINNPLTFMYLRTAAIERWAEKLAPDVREDLTAQLSELRAGADRVSRIVQDLRTFSRASNQSRGPTDLRTVLDFVERIAASELRDRAELVIDCDSLPPVDGEQGRLEQVFLNLVLNAVQAMPEAGPERNRVMVRARLDGEFVLAEVEDNGDGMPDDVAARAFDPFFTTKPVGVGTGLGLAICHGIITQLGGSITVDSAVGRGTTFRVALPIHTAVRSQ